MLETPLAPTKKPSVNPAVAQEQLSPTALNLSNIERNTEERPSNSFNGSQLRLERQNAVMESPVRSPDRMNDSNAALVDAIERNTSQLREMFDNLSHHVDEIEKRINQSENPDNQTE